MTMPDKYNPAIPSEGYNIADYNALMSSNIPATLAGAPRMNFDSAEDASIFFARELDYIKARTYDIKRPGLTALELFPVSSEVDIGAESITYYGYDMSGFAEIIQNYANDLPRADTHGEPTTSPIMSLGIAYGYSVQEMRASRMAGKSLDARRAAAARRGIEEKINRIAWAGDPKTKLLGVLSPENNIPLFTLPKNAAGTSTKFVDKTPMEILADVNGMVNYTARLTHSVERPDTLALPTEAYLHIAQTPMVIDESTGATGTILKWILDNSPRLKKIVEVPELNAAAGISPYPDQDVAFMYSKDPEKFSVEIPMPFFQHPAQQKNLAIDIPCEARAAGVIIYYPLSMLVIPGV